MLCVLMSTPLLLWITHEPLSARFETPYIALTNSGRLLGIMAMVMFCLNVILSARVSLLETLFGGLNKVFIAHHIIGGLALITILAHPLLLALRHMSTSPINAAKQLIPFMNDTMTTVGIVSLWLFVSLMVITLYIKLPYKIWLLTHKFMGLVLLGIVVHIILGSADINQDLRLKVFAWVLLAMAVMAFVYRTILPRLFVRRYHYTISTVSQPTVGVTRISMKPIGRSMRYQAGQFLFVSFKSEGFSHEWHPFTISSHPGEEELAITVKDLGAYTSTLVRLAPGMVGMAVDVEGAYGRFSFQHFRSKRQIWIAGGIGITPFLSMAADVTAPYQVDLYYSVKSASEIIDGRYLQQLITASNGALRVIPQIAETDGMLSAERIAEYSGDLMGVDVLLCGPPPMMHALKSQLRTKGVRRSKLHSEEFSMS